MSHFIQRDQWYLVRLNSELRPEGGWIRGRMVVSDERILVLAYADGREVLIPWSAVLLIEKGEEK